MRRSYTVIESYIGFGIYLTSLGNSIVRPGVSDRTLPFTVNLGWSTVNWVKQHRYALIVQNNRTTDDKGDQLYTVSGPGKRSQANLNGKPYGQKYHFDLKKKMKLF